MTSPEPLHKEQKVRNTLRKALGLVVPHVRRVQQRYEQQFPDVAGKRPIEQIAHATDPARRKEVKELLTDHLLSEADSAMHRIEDVAGRVDKKVLSWLRRHRKQQPHQLPPGN